MQYVAEMAEERDHSASILATGGRAGQPQPEPLTLKAHDGVLISALSMRPHSRRASSCYSTRLTPARQNTRQLPQSWPLRVIPHWPSTNDPAAPFTARTRPPLGSASRRHTRTPRLIWWQPSIGRCHDISRSYCGKQLLGGAHLRNRSRARESG